MIRYFERSITNRTFDRITKMRIIVLLVKFWKRKIMLNSEKIEKETI